LEIILIGIVTKTVDAQKNIASYNLPKTRFNIKDVFELLLSGSVMVQGPLNLQA
jgi:hypothetical protein